MRDALPGYRFAHPGYSPLYKHVAALICPTRRESVARQAHLSLDVDNLDPIRAIADWKATGLAQLPGALVDLVDRQAVRFFT